MVQSVSFRAALLLFVLPVLGVTETAAQSARSGDEIGVTAALNPNATGTPPQSQPRLLDVGVNVFADEKIVTTEGGQAQMLFVDESAFTVGPNSEVVLDEFVFDPETGTGKLALTATKGVFRFVGGKISKRTPVTLKTPTAVIGIRGGIALVNVQPGGATQATFLFGDQMTVAAAGVTQTVSRPGFAITAETADQAPSEPAPAPPEQLNAALNSLERDASAQSDEQGGTDQEQASPQQGQSQAQSGDQEGGGQQQSNQQNDQEGGGQRRQVPTDDDVAQTSLGSQGSQRPPRAIAPPAIIALGPTPPVGAAGGGNPGAETTNEAQQNNTLQQNLLPSASGLSGRYKRSLSRLAGTQDTVSTGNIPFSGGTLSSGSFSVPLGSSTLKFPILSTGITGITSAGATDSPFGTFTGDVFLAQNAQFLFLEGKETNNSDNLIFAFAGKPSASVPTTGASFFALQNDFGLSSGVPFVRSQEAGGITVPEAESAADAAIYWDVSGSTTAQRSFGFRTIAIDGQGTSQKSLMSIGGGAVKLDSQGRPFIDGGAIGSVRSNLVNLPTLTESELSSADDNLGNDFFGPNGSFFVLESAQVDNADSVVSNTGAQAFIPGQATATYFPTNVALPATSALGSRTTRTMAGYLGGAYQTSVNGTLSTTTMFDGVSEDSGDVVLKTSAAANKVQAQFRFSNAFGTGSTFQVLFGDKDSAFGDSTTTTAESIFVDDDTIAAGDQDNGVTLGGSPQNMSSVAFVSVSDASEFSSGFLPSGVSVCDCKFLNWGFWSGQVSASSSSSEVIHMANYVAGQVANLAAINAQQGTATYAGHAIGTVFTNAQVYQAIGGLSATVNFDTPSASTFNITNFDGENYAGTGLAITGNSSSHKFTGSLANSGSTRTGGFAGSFMAGGGSSVAEMGGQFKVDGGGYSAVGVFAAKK